MSTTIHGASDDLIEIEGDIREEFGVYGIDELDDAYVAFSNGTVLRIAFTKGVWRLSPVVDADGTLSIVQAPEDDDDNYSDVATIDAPIAWVMYGTDLALGKFKVKV